MSLTPLTPTVHAPDEYVKLYAQLIESLSAEAGLINQVRHTYESEPVGKTISAARLNLWRSILAAHQERITMLESLMSTEFELLEFQREVEKPAPSPPSNT